MKRKLNKQNSGFITIIFSLIVSITTLLIFSYAFIFYFQKQKSIFKKICYIELVNFQKKIVQLEKNLFQLNSLSTYYRSYLLILKIQLAAAIASENVPLAAKITLEISKQLDNQKILDSVQKKIIQSGNYLIELEKIRLMQKISFINSSEQLIWRNLLQENKVLELLTKPEFAVIADSVGGVAPNYILKNDYQRLQTLALSMQIHYSTNNKTQKLIDSKQFYESTCHVQIQKLDDEWNLKITKDKYLQKPYF